MPTADRPSRDGMVQAARTTVPGEALRVEHDDADVTLRLSSPEARGVTPAEVEAAARLDQVIDGSAWDAGSGPGGAGPAVISTP